MSYVILRDDDVNGTTPPALLERLYRPFLDRGMPVSLAAIPEVRTDVTTATGEIEVFVHGPRRGQAGTAPLAENAPLLAYLREERGYRIAMHGCHHEIVDGRFELDRDDARDIDARLSRGLERLRQAGFDKPVAFVAPQDQISRAGVVEVMRRFTVLSTGYFDLARVPRALWPSYLAQKKLAKRPHFRAGNTVFLSHPGCILARDRRATEMVDAIERLVRQSALTVVVSHHSEYFGRDGEEHAEMIDALHALVALFARERVRVVGFEEAARLV